MRGVYDARCHALESNGPLLSPEPRRLHGIQAPVPVRVHKHLWVASLRALFAPPHHEASGLEDEVHFAEVDIEGAKEVYDVDAEDAVN